MWRDDGLGIALVVFNFERRSRGRANPGIDKKDGSIVSLQSSQRGRKASAVMSWRRRQSVIVAEDTIFLGSRPRPAAFSASSIV